MKALKINKDTRNMVINLLQNINNLVIEDFIIDNCCILVNEKEDIVGTISYERFSKLALIRYFVFKRSVSKEDLSILYNCLEEDLKKKNIISAVGIVNSDEVKEVFKCIGFQKIDKEKVFFEETLFTKTNLKDNDVFIKKVN